MDSQDFQGWLSAAGGLTRAQRREALAVLSGRSAGEASKAAIELAVDEARRCPHCATEGAVSRGKARGLRRYQCKGCGRTFNALTGTPLSGLHHKERWLSFGASLAEGETVKASAERCGVAASTAFRWRHRFLAAARGGSGVLKGIVEADETYMLESRKGTRKLGRKARRRGGKAKKRGLSREQVPVLMAVDRGGTTFSAVLPRVDTMVLTAALDPVLAKDALLVSDGGASYPPCAAALGVSHESRMSFPVPAEDCQPETGMAVCPAGRGSTCTVTLRRPSRAASILIIRSRVKRPRAALRMREKSAAAKPVMAPALRTVRPCSSRIEMMRAARIALACLRSASGSSKSRKTLPLPSTASKSLSFMSTAPFSIGPAGSSRGRSRTWGS